MSIQPHILKALKCPKDGTAIGEDLRTEGGNQYHMTEAGVLVLDADLQRPLDVVYSHPEFAIWESMMDERLKYYTEDKGVAGVEVNIGFG